MDLNMIDKKGLGLTLEYDPCHHSRRELALREEMAQWEDTSPTTAEAESS